jgi:hypothetical protein
LDVEQDFCARCEKNVPQNLFATHLEAIHHNDKDILGLIDSTVNKIGIERKENWIKNMVIQVIEFSSEWYKIGKIFA